MDINIGEYIRTFRQAKNLTLEELAGRAGISISFLSDLERGRSMPSIGTLDAIATAFGMTLAIRFMDNHGKPFGYEMVNANKWEALKQAFYALDAEE